MAIYFINFSLRRTIRRNISMKANKLYLLKSLNMDAIWMSLVAVKRVWVKDIKKNRWSIMFKYILFLSMTPIIIVKYWTEYSKNLNFTYIILNNPCHTVIMKLNNNCSCIYIYWDMLWVHISLKNMWTYFRTLSTIYVLWC